MTASSNSRRGRLAHRGCRRRRMRRTSPIGGAARTRRLAHRSGAHAHRLRRRRGRLSAHSGGVPRLRWAAVDRLRPARGEPRRLHRPRRFDRRRLVVVRRHVARTEFPRRAALPRHPLRIRRGSRSATSSTVDLTGDLTLLGVTRPLTVEVEVKRLGGARLAFVAHARIDRLAYGMNSGFPIISRDVDLTVSSEALAG